MPALNLAFMGLQDETPWPDLKGKSVIHLGKGAPPIGVAVMEHGMTSGQPSIAMRLTLPNGETVIAETSARLFCTAARAIISRYPNLFEDGGGPLQ